MKLSATSRNYTEFYGTKGVFQSPKSSVKLHYVLATAGAGDSSSHGSRQLLSHLKPLRDYVNIQDVNDLSDILQRDLSDNRVAKGIVRYLIDSNNNSPIFFPSIVVVLIPRDFFKNQQVVEEYPIPQWSADSKTCSFGDKWIEEPVSAGEGQHSGVSKVKIDFNETIPLVIDGQHRTAGFRFVSDAMDFEGANRVFQPFYKDYADLRPREFKSDLPLTLIWFESLDKSNQIRVKDFARNMFVDINQSSQQISASRKILLDEKKPHGFLTRAFYDFIARNKGYEIGDDISLFHSGFDFPHDLKDVKPWSKQTIFLPEIIDLVIRGILYNNRVMYGSVTTNLLGFSESKAHFDSYFGKKDGGPFDEFHKEEGDIDGHSWFETKTGDSNGIQVEFAEQFVKRVGVPLYDWINHNHVFRVSAQVSKQLEEGCNSGAEEPYSSTYFAETWMDIVCSGLGLYYDYQDADRLKSIQGNAIRAVDKKFIELFEAAFWEAEPEAARSVYNASRSVMYFLGYGMLIDVVARLRDNFDLTSIVKELIVEYDVDKQMRIAMMLAQLRTNSNLQFSGKFSFIKSPDPKSWPKYRNIFLRFHSDVEKLLSSLDMLEWQIFKPEWEKIGKEYFRARSKPYDKKARQAWVNGDASKVDLGVWNSEREKLIGSISELFEVCGLTTVTDFK